MFMHQEARSAARVTQREKHMRTTALASVWTAAALAGGAATELAARSPPIAAGSVPFTVYNLGTLGGSFSSGNAINDLGWVLGNANLAGDQLTHATVWIDGMKADLGTLGGANSVVEWPVHNDRGVIPGAAETAELDPLREAWSCSAFFPGPPTLHVCLGFRYREGKMSALPTLGGVNGYGAGVNQRGDIVGWAETPVHDSTCVAPQVLQFEAVVWPADGGVHALPPYAGDPDGAATAINDSGEVVGISGTCDVAVGAGSARHALIWRHGAPTLIPTFGGHGWNTPTDINRSGQVVGFADIPDDLTGGVLTPFPLPLGFIWSAAAGTLKIAPLPGDRFAIAYAINDWGAVVGQSFGGPEGSRAFIWINGKSYDLNSFLPQGSALYLVYAEGINDLGEITGGACELVDGACPSSGAITPAFLAVPGFGNADEAAAALEQAGAAAVAPAVAVSQEIYRRPLRRFGAR
jgi:probable HAF family extracellular repeat protein